MVYRNLSHLACMPNWVSGSACKDEANFGAREELPTTCRAPDQRPRHGVDVPVEAARRVAAAGDGSRVDDRDPVRMEGRRR